jgi:GNAT superfamily N-acetyltransferase
MEELYQIKKAKSPGDYKNAKELFIEYIEHLRLDYQFFEQEKDYDTLQQMYNQKNGGVLLIIWDKKQAIGCGGLRKFDTYSAELKRMYIKFEYQGLGLGKQLLKELIQEARKLGYKKILLDTLPAMASAIHLYEEVGFKEVKRFNENPSPDARFFALSLE